MMLVTQLYIQQSFHEYLSTCAYFLTLTQVQKPDSTSGIAIITETKV